MNNKVLIKLIVPEIDETYDLFVPVNEILWKVEKMIIQSIHDLSGGSLDVQKKYILINKVTGYIYPPNITVYDSDIRNASELLLVSLIYY